MKQLQQRQKTVLIKSSFIFIIFCIASLLQEYVIQYFYINSSFNYPDHIRVPSTFVLVPSTIGWIATSLLSYKKSEQEMYIPSQKLLLCGVVLGIGSIAFNTSLFLLNFPFVLMLRGFNILPILIMKFIISNEKNKKNNVPLILIIFSSLLMFFLGQSIQNYAKIEYNRKILYWILAFFVSDAFLPFVQREIISKYNPSPLQMLREMNKWCTVVTLTYILLSDQLNDIIYFFYYNVDSFVHLIILSSLGVIGQCFVLDLMYNSEHLLTNLLISFRKIVSGLISILIFNHGIKIPQMIALGVLTATVMNQLKKQWKNKNEIWGQKKQSAEMESIVEQVEDKN